MRPPGVLLAVEVLSFCKHSSSHSVSRERVALNASDALVETDSRCILKSVPEVLKLKVFGKPLLIRTRKIAQMLSFWLLQLIRE